MGDVPGGGPVQEEGGRRMKRVEMLEAAAKCVCGQRQEDYGEIEDNFGTIAALWSVYKGTEFTAKDVAMMMALLKIARIRASDKVDSYVDLAGYAACGCEIATREVKT